MQKYLRTELKKLAFYDWNSSNIQEMLHVTFALKYRLALYSTTSLNQTADEYKLKELNQKAWFLYLKNPMTEFDR